MRSPVSPFSEFRLALVQLAVGASKGENLRRAADFVREAASNGARLVSLPECFNSPYGTRELFKVSKSRASVL